MATDLLRVIVLSREPVPVTTVLRFKLPGCLPVSVPSVDDVAPKLRPDAIVLLDLGDGGASLEAARRLRARDIRHGIVVIGTSATAGLPGVIGLQPPFQLSDLSAAMDRAREHSVHPPSAEGAEEPPLLFTEVEGARGSTATTPAPSPPTTAASAPTSSIPPTTRPEPSPPTAPTATPEPASTGPAPPTPPVKPRRGPAEGAASLPPAGPSEAPAPPSRAPSPPSQVPDHDVAPEAPAPAASTGPAAATPVRRGPPTVVPQVAFDAVTSADESLFTGRAPSHPAGAATQDSGPAEPLRSKVDRWRKRLTAPAAEEPAEPSEQELHQRLVRIFAATSQIESIAAELPIVTDRAALYQAIAMAVADEFTADTVVLWRRAHNGWVAAAHRGLTSREASLPVGFDQPVLRDVDAQTGAILLDPTASFQNLISGIGGAHTESFMASSIAVGTNRLGILAVGRDEPLVEADLDRLVEMAVEAAVGIGVAEHIQRMSSLVTRMGAGGPTRASEPGQWREEFLDELKEAWHARQQGGEGASADPAAAAGLWSALAGPGEATSSPDLEGQAASADEPETVIDLTQRSTKRA